MNLEAYYDYEAQLACLRGALIDSGIHGDSIDILLSYYMDNQDVSDRLDYIIQGEVQDDDIYYMAMETLEYIAELNDE